MGCDEMECKGRADDQMAGGPQEQDDTLALSENRKDIDIVVLVQVF